MGDYIRVSKEAFQSQRKEVLTNRRKLQKLKDETYFLKSIIAENSNILNELNTLFKTDPKEKALDWVKNIKQGILDLKNDVIKQQIYIDKCQKAIMSIDKPQTYVPSIGINIDELLIEFPLKDKEKS